MRIRFLGATGTVTGSKFLVETARARVLVDLGLFQGPRAHRRRNWDPLPVDLSSIDAAAVTHAHIDHSGALPRLWRAGLRAGVYASGATYDVLQFLLPDSGRLHEEDARYANRKGFSKHRPALPLYTERDARPPSCRR